VKGEQVRDLILMIVTLPEYNINEVCCIYFTTFGIFHTCVNLLWNKIFSGAMLENFRGKEKYSLLIEIKGTVILQKSYLLTVVMLFIKDNALI
jgi:hypothetical protein